MTGLGFDHVSVNVCETSVDLVLLDAQGVSRILSLTWREVTELVRKKGRVVSADALLADLKTGKNK